MGGFELPSMAIRELLGAAFDLVIQMNRFRDGSRRVTAVREVQVVSGELVTRELFRFEADGGGRERGTGNHVATGIRPAFLPRLAGLPGFSEDLFEPAAVVDRQASSLLRAPSAAASRSRANESPTAEEV
jgi:hypothetical protein